MIDIRPAATAAERLASRALCAGLLILPMISFGGRPATIAASDLALPVLLLVTLPFMSRRPSWLVFPRIVETWPLAPFAMWLAWLALSAAIGAHFHLASLDPYVLKKLLGFILLALYVVAGWLVADRIGYDDLVKVLLWSAAAGSVIGYLRLYFLPSDIGYASLPYGYRLLGMTHNPNLFGLQQAAVLIMCLDWIRRVPGRRWTEWQSLQDWLIAIVLAGLWLSGSRTAMMALLIALLAAVVMGRLPLSLLARYAVLSAAIATACFVVFSGYRAVAIDQFYAGTPVKPPGWIAMFFSSLDHVGVMIAAEPQGIDHRAYIHERALDVFLQQPWFGTGLGQFYLDFRASGDPLAGEIHNSFLWILTELGVVGLLIALWAIWEVGVRALRLSISRRLIAPLALIIFYAAAAFGADVAFQRPLYFFAGAFAAAAWAARSTVTTAAATDRALAR